MEQSAGRRRRRTELKRESDRAFQGHRRLSVLKPSPCARRVSWIAHGFEQEVEDDPFMALLRRLGERHEHAHVATFPGILDLSPLKDDPEERERRLSRRS